MRTAIPTNPDKNHRFPGEIISQGVWLYYRLCLSYRDVEELLFERGVIANRVIILFTPVGNLADLTASV